MVMYHDGHLLNDATIEVELPLVEAPFRMSLLQES